MFRPLVISLMVATTTSVSTAAELIKAPSGGLAPAVVLVKKGKSGKLIVHRTIERVVTRTKFRIVDGQKKRFAVKQTVSATYLIEMSVSRVSFFDTENKKLARDFVLESLAKPRIAILSANGRKVDPYYLQVVKSGTLVLVHQPKPKE